MIKGTGVDLISIRRIEQVYRRHPRRFLRKIFTTRERGFIIKKSYPAAAMAARFAAKEAVLKAIGCGIGPAGLGEVEVLSSPGGQPRVKLHGRAALEARRRGISRIEISLTHDPPFACAIAIAH
ncbi:MAG: holo-ACP synthase [Firmicutes bacterium]|nr:holo-ACP synthase [Bacillota bacterium]